jgi:hypothetical protein
MATVDLAMNAAAPPSATAAAKAVTDATIRFEIADRRNVVLACMSFLPPVFLPSVSVRLKLSFAAASQKEANT